MDTPEYQGVMRAHRATEFQATLGTRLPSLDMFDRAVARLSERKARRRLERVEATLAVLEHVHALVTEAMHPGWRLDPDHPDYRPE